MPKKQPPITDAPASISKFDTLNQAIEFIVACLDREDYASLSDACARTYATERAAPQLPTYVEYRSKAIRALALNHQRTSLISLCAGMTFPSDTTRYLIGGHADGWNHVNLEFRQSKQGWVLDEIWICR